MINETDRRMLLLIVEKIERLEMVCREHTFEEIKENFVYSDTIQYEFEKIYEDTTRLSTLFKIYNPDIPIDKLRGIRNRVAHDYEAVVIKILVDTVINDLPPLKEKIKSLLNR